MDNAHGRFTRRKGVNFEVLGDNYDVSGAGLMKGDLERGFRLFDRRGGLGVTLTV